MESPSVEKKMHFTERKPKKNAFTSKKKTTKRSTDSHLPTQFCFTNFETPTISSRKKILHFAVLCKATKWSTSSVTDTLDGRPGDAVETKKLHQALLSLKLRALPPWKLLLWKMQFPSIGAFRSIFRYQLSVSFREDRDTGDANWVMFQCGTHRGFQQLWVLRRFGAFSLHIICTLETVFSFRKSGNSKIFPKQPMVSNHHWWAFWVDSNSRKRLVMIWDYFSFWDERGFWFFTHVQISKPPTVWTVIRGN